jgi:protoporphyrin/coproporphyrin ferrochelatase
MVEGNHITAESTGLPYDAVLVISFGGPEGTHDVMPFLENVLRGRNVPRQRLLEVAKHYELFGGISPINEQNRKLISALKQELENNGPRLPIYFGNRNWHPLLPDTMRQMRDDGVKRALGFVTSAYSSYASCRQYLENIESARETIGPDATQVDKLRAFYNHPLFIQANVAQIRAALDQFPKPQRLMAHMVFTAHSIPQSMAHACVYEAQLRETSALIAESLGIEKWQLVFQSRSGPPVQPWLGPDVRDYLREVHALGTREVVLAPIGFVSDHMEIIYDLDTEARRLCDELGLNMIRAETVGTHPAFIGMIRELILERVVPGREKRYLGAAGPAKDTCAAGCCML